MSHCQDSGATKRISASFKYMIVLMVMCISLLLVTTESYAASSNTAPRNADIEQIMSQKPNPKVDGEVAHLWFELMFGEFIWAPWDKSCISDKCTTVLSKAIGYSNVLALLMGIVISYYLVLGGAINTGHTGELLGKSWSSVWLPIRTSFAFGMIIPIKAVGVGVFSFIQLFVMWLIILGSNAGSLLWNNLALEFTKGAPVIGKTVTGGMAPANNMLNILLCTKAGLEELGGTQKVIEISYHDWMKLSTSVNATAGRNLPTNLLSKINDGAVSKVRFGPEGNCGTLSFPDLTADKGSKSNNEIYEKAVAAYKKDIVSLGNDIAGIVNQVFSRHGGSGKTILTLEAEKDASTIKDFQAWGASLFTSGLDYDISVRSDIEKSIASSKYFDDQRTSMLKGGWPSAGSWYFEVSKFQAFSNEIARDALNIIPVAGKGDVCDRLLAFWQTCSNENISNMFAIGSAIAKEAINYGGSKSRKKTSDAKNIVADEELFYQRSVAMDINTMAEDPSASSTALTTSWAKSLLSTVAGSSWFAGEGMYGERCTENASTNYKNGSQQCEYGMSNPFYVVTSIGQSLTDLSITVFGISVLMDVARELIGDNSGLIGTAVKTTVSILPGGSILKFLGDAIGVVLKRFAELATVLAGITAAQGFVLGFAVPFMPIMTWIMMICGYLLTIVEALVAAPLAVIMMATPEGEGISGTRMQSAINMIAAIVLKPSLMVIGLIASLTLGNIFFAILNQYFWTSTDRFMDGGILEFVFLISLYVGLAYKICEYTVSVMYKLPSQILDWFAPGASRAFGENEINGAVAGAGQSAAGGAKALQEGSRKWSEQRAQKNKDRDMARTFIEEFKNAG